MESKKLDMTFHTHTHTHTHTPWMSLSIQAAITVSQTKLFLTNKFISHCSVGWKFKIRMPAWSCSGEDSLPGCRLLTSCCVLKLGWPQSAVAWSRTLVPQEELKSGYGSEIPESLPLDQQNQWPVTKPWPVGFVEMNFHKEMESSEAK